MRLFTGREAYGDLANVVGGRCSAKHACEHFVLVLTEFASLPPHQAGAGRAADEGRREDPVEQRRPTNTSSRAEVFLSGALHGDERGRAAATLATMKFIARASACHADKHSAENCPHLTPGERASFGQGTLAAKRLAWLSHLSRTRIVYALPATNPWGFANRKRTEVRIDTNRDFAIDTTPSACAQSATGRVVNESSEDTFFRSASRSTAAWRRSPTSGARRPTTKRGGSIRMEGGCAWRRRGIWRRTTRRRFR